MKIYNGQYGWSTSAHSKTKEGEKIQHYISCSFAKNSEPKTESVEGKLIFRLDSGEERECFLSSYNTKHGTMTKLVIMSSEENKAKDMQTNLTGTDRDVLGFVDPLTIDESELPFY